MQTLTNGVTPDADEGLLKPASTSANAVENATPSEPIAAADELEDTIIVANHDFAQPNGDEPHFPTRGFKRKHSESFEQDGPKTKRPPSPPWRSFEAQGPSRFQQEGRRKSGRTNALPLELQPQTTKRQTRAAYNHVRGGRHQLPSHSVGRGASRQHKTSPSTNKSQRTSAINPNPKSRVTLDANGTTNSPSRQQQLSSTKSRSLAPETPKHVHKPAVKPPTRKPPHDAEKTRRQPPRHPDNHKVQYTSSKSYRRSYVDRSIPEIPLPSRPVKSLRLNFRRPPLPVLNPGNVLPRRRYESFQDCLDQISPLAEDGERPLTIGQARNEARVLQMVLQDAATPGGILQKHHDAIAAGVILSKDYYVTDEIRSEADPVPKSSHNDFLHAHIEMFVKELNSEQSRHRREAKNLAHAALHRWNRKRPKTREEQLAEEHQRLKNIHRWMFKELQNKWRAVAAVAKQRKLDQHEQELEALGKQALSDLLERSTQSLAQRRRRTMTSDGYGVRYEDSSQLPSEGDQGEEEDEEDDDESQEDDRTSSDEDNDEDDSSDDVDSDSEGAVREDEDNELSLQQLRQKYASIPDIPQDAPDEDPRNATSDTDIEMADLSTLAGTEYAAGAEDAIESELGVSLRPIDPSMHEVEEVADELLDDEDESESDDGTEDSDADEESNAEDEDEDDDSDESSQDEDEGIGSGLLGLFSQQTRRSWASAKEASEGAVEANDEANSTQLGPVRAQYTHVASDIYTTTSEEPSALGTPATTVTPKPSEIESISVDDHEQETAELPSFGKPEPGTIKTSVPSLLRGQLREYQHHGLDWLAGMYANDTNGILADEMGLGKTIQTIALLAHLATEKEVWGPHLIVVPTSVMLNWEVEFNKWCPGFKILTYYGTQDERKAKRRGWAEKERYNVWITSYQLALQDAHILKRREWHYMVLDEAHNIKNFRSQRWKTLLMFNSQARLLLTGTPLQNNLTELWSLLFFLAPESDEEGRSRFADLKTFSTMFKHPVEQILDHGREAMDDEAKDIVGKLHRVLRPHLLRRLKSEVEKQMPKKFEHVVKCRLSKRQRQLYDGYMGLAGTKASFESGSYLSIINCLMQLRKVCNHPDLFETRQIVTSYAMPKSAIADYEIKELLLRKRLLEAEPNEGDTIEGFNLWRPNTSKGNDYRTQQLAALDPLAREFQRQNMLLQKRNNAPQGLSTLSSCINAMSDGVRRSRLEELQSQYFQTATRVQRRPVYDTELIDQLWLDKPGAKPWMKDLSETSNVLQDMFSLQPSYNESTTMAVQKFGFVTPAVVAPNMARMALTSGGVEVVRSLQQADGMNPYHESQTRLSIAFPDKGLIQYDCGKLQQLDRLLRDLQSGGHRALIFTQMTKVLDILEQFLNLHGHRYLRLDGSTKVEQRQALTDQFNRDTRILAFILSSRSGGLGINLTGADTVIFYDLDWNPAMDKQCQDRCHRIGQTRDVHIYRFVSEGTIEANILRKSNQKRMLDDVVIQEGEFTTDVFYREAEDDINEQADAALDKVLGGLGNSGGRSQEDRALEQAEDKEDREAARQAQKEYIHTDDADFVDKTSTSRPQTPDAKYFESPRPVETGNDTQVNDTELNNMEMRDADEDDEGEEPGSYEEYMLRFMDWELRDTVIQKPGKKKPKKTKDHPTRIRR